MPLASRPNGSNYFTTLPAVDPAVGAKLDQEFNALVSVANSIDNANISTSPKIAGAKVDLTTSGYLPLTGGDLSGLLTHNFDGIFRLMRASGNGRIREYRGSDGAVWGIVYNTSYNEGGATWNGRDVTDVCLLLRMKSTGLAFDYAASAGVGVAPTWTTLFEFDATGLVTSANFRIQEANINWATAGGISQIALLEGVEYTHTGDTTWTTIDTIKIYVPSTANSLEYHARLHRSANGNASMRLNIGATNGTSASMSGAGYVWAGAGTIDISALSGWQEFNIQIQIDNAAETVYIDKAVARII